MSMPRNMISVWEILTDPIKERRALNLMIQSKDRSIADQAYAFKNASDDNREMQGIRNSIRVGMGKTFNEKAILSTMARTNVDFSTIGKVPTTVYICLPGDMAVTHNRYMRLLITMILSEIERGGLRHYADR